MRAAKKDIETELFRDRVREVRQRSECVMIYLGVERARQPEKRTFIESQMEHYRHAGFTLLINKKFVAPFEYVIHKFPKADLTAIEAFMVLSADMDELGLVDAGGAFVRAERNIIIRSGATFRSRVSSPHAFQRAMSRLNADFEIEDVFAHELLHAVSHRTVRAGRNVQAFEEGFAYRNTVDWLVQRGYSYDRIIEQNFLPFLVHRVMSMEFRKISDALAIETGEEMGRFGLDDPKRMQKFCDDHAEELVGRIVSRAKGIGKKMIEEYSVTKPVVQSKDTDRFNAIDLG